MATDNHLEMLANRVHGAMKAMDLDDYVLGANMALDAIRDRIEETEDAIMRHERFVSEPYVGYGFDHPGEEQTRSKQLAELRYKLTRYRRIVVFLSALEAWMNATSMQRIGRAMHSAFDAFFQKKKT